MNDATINTNLLDLVERITILEMELKSIRVEQDESKVSRRLLHEKLDRIIENNVEAKEGIRTLSEEVKDMKPILTLHERLVQQGKGAFWIVALILSSGLLSAGFVLQRVWTWFWTK
jgi:hypothetical protein